MKHFKSTRLYLLCGLGLLLGAAGCSSKANDTKTTQAEAANFNGENLDPAWRGWKPGMPMPEKKPAPAPK